MPPSITQVRTQVIVLPKQGSYPLKIAMAKALILQLEEIKVSKINTILTQLSYVMKYNEIVELETGGFD